MTNITIKGIEYQVISSKTPDQFKAEGLINVAAHMTQNGIAEDLYIARPAGETVYSSARLVNGRYARPIKINRSLMTASEFRTA